jgi:hypothetical protein
LSFFIGNAFYASHADKAMQPTEPPIARLLVGCLLHKVLHVAKMAEASHSNTLRVARRHLAKLEYLGNDYKMGRM